MDPTSYGSKYLCVSLTYVIKLIADSDPDVTSDYEPYVKKGLIWIQSKNSATKSLETELAFLSILTKVIIKYQLINENNYSDFHI